MKAKPLKFYFPTIRNGKTAVAVHIGVLDSTRNHTSTSASLMLRVAKQLFRKFIAQHNGHNLQSHTSAAVKDYGLFVVREEVFRATKDGCHFVCLSTGEVVAKKDLRLAPKTRLSVKLTNEKISTPVLFDTIRTTIKSKTPMPPPKHTFKRVGLGFCKSYEPHDKCDDSKHLLL